MNRADARAALVADPFLTESDIQQKMITLFDRGLIDVTEVRASGECVVSVTPEGYAALSEAGLR